jgi:hypothetical protein
MRHDLEWVTAPPLWDLAQADSGGRARFRQPALLRFDSDAFMEDLTALLQRGDERFADRVVRPETWDRPASGWAEAGDASLASAPRLYQPAHGRFYVTAASLVCRRVGLPMRRVDAAAGERASMLMRRLVERPGRVLDSTDPETFIEQAWIGDRKSGAWRLPVGVIDQDEERLPLFPLAAADAPARKRQVWAGLLPVASREIYEGARPAGVVGTVTEDGDRPDDLAELSDPRKATFVARVVQGLETLSATAPASASTTVLKELREALAFALLDLADFLAAELPEIWRSVRAGGPAPTSATDRAVLDLLNAAFVGSGTWRGALIAAEAHRPVLLGTGVGTGPVPVPDGVTADEVRLAVDRLLQGGHFQTTIFDALDQALPISATPIGGAPVTGARAAEDAEADGGLYWLRFVYERSVCERFHDPVISEPSRPFRLGAFFDPDAPARPLVIRMPFDTSPRGLRRFPKGVAVLMSAKLRQQVERVRDQKLQDLDQGKVGDVPALRLGIICSLSIPIITLCALIVLMIFLQLLNIVFWWMPYFKICLPVPQRSR